MQPEETIVEARSLSKHYGDLRAVDGVDFEMLRAECVGFLGPNGAGKTTTVRMVSCFTPITSGTVEVFGWDVAQHPREVKATLGVCPQEDNLDPDFSVERNLLAYARYFRIPRTEARRRTTELLQLMQLTEKRHVQIDELSGGMKRRLILARALLNQPRLLLLDEPTTGLDPQARHMIWHRIRDLKAGGTSILLTTHYMEEASHLCDRVILMDHGRILLEGPPAELIEREIGREVIEIWNHGADLLAFLEDVGWAHEIHDERVYVYLPPGSDGGRALGQRFPHQEHLLRQATLEDVFFRRAGRALED